jgi:HD superfamily phosphodiesterase
VAEAAAWLAARIAANGIPIDRPLVEAAALLHDVDKALPPDDRASALPHGDGSADWLSRRGHPELARAVANHPVTRLANEDRYRRWSAFATREERIVAYADKRCGQRLESLAERFAGWRRRWPAREDGGSTWDRATIDRVWARAKRLERDVCRAAGVGPDEVRRLRWTGAALAAAKAAP